MGDDNTARLSEMLLLADLPSQRITDAQREFVQSHCDLDYQYPPRQEEKKKEPIKKTDAKWPKTNEPKLHAVRVANKSGAHSYILSMNEVDAILAQAWTPGGRRNVSPRPRSSP